MSERKHTQLPWGIERTRDRNWIGPMRADGIKINEIVCHTDREDLKPEYLERNDADAEFIVRAVNNYDGLLKALMMIPERYLDDMDRHTPSASNLIRAAIAKAIGE